MTKTHNAEKDEQKFYFHSKRKHGQSATNKHKASRTYVTWNSLGQNHDLPKRWLHFENFYADMGDKPKGSYVNRLDWSKPHGPGNTYWATHRLKGAPHAGIKSLEILVYRTEPCSTCSMLRSRWMAVLHGCGYLHCV